MLQAVTEPGALYRRNVGIMLLNAEGLAWVGQRIDTPGAWQMPLGGIDKGETPAGAALRELAEEIGTGAAEILIELPGWFVYDLPAEIAARWGRGKWLGQAQRWFVMRFTGRDAEIDLKSDHPEFSAWRWVARAELPGLAVGFKRPVYEA